MLSPEKFLKELHHLLPFPEQKSFLLAVSGGVDSMVLSELFRFHKEKYGFSFDVAHINYGLRGVDSDADQNLVEHFCSEHNIPFHLYKMTEKDNKPKGSIQLWARDLRYNFFSEIMQKESIDFLATAHHLNDQLETFFINLLRGSGINGLCGIPAKENNILRPLLSFTKEEIYAFAEENGISFREDVSNQKNDYLRNKIRNMTIPNLLNISPDFLQDFSKSVHILKETKDFIQQQTDEILAKITIKNSSDERILDKEKLSQETEFAQFEILRKFGFDKRKEIKKIFATETGKIFHSEENILLINRNQLIIKKKELNIDNEEVTLNEEAQIDLSQWTENYTDAHPDFWIFDKDKLRFPLKIRRKQDGDFFYPKGFNGKKKISKFFKDEKISIFAKSKIWLLCDAENRVMGILPMRQDRRFLPDEETKNTIKIKLK